MSFGEQLAQQVGGAAAGSAVGAGMNLIFGKMQDKRQEQQQQKLTDQQVRAEMQLGQFNYDQQLKMWNATNSEAQMKHLKDAGLNPALMYGGSGAGGSTISGGQAGNATGGQAAPTQSTGGGQGMNVLTAAQLDLMKAQAENLRADAAKKSGIDTTLATTENEIKKLDLKVSENTLWDKINYIVSQTIEQQEKGLIAGQQRTIGEETVPDQILKVKTEAITAGIQQQLLKHQITLNDAQVHKIAADIVQRGQEINIKAFEAEIEANQPGVGKIVGNIILSLKERIDNILGIGKEYTQPRKIGK